MDLKDFYEDKKFVQSRIPFIQVAAVLLFLLLLIGLWNLQLLKSRYYIELAEKNRIRSIPLAAPRGKILDRNGQKLVTNIPGLAVQIRITDLPKRRSVRLREIRALARVVQVPASQIGGTLRRHRNDPLTPVKQSGGADQTRASLQPLTPQPWPSVTFRKFVTRPR